MSCNSFFRSVALLGFLALVFVAAPPVKAQVLKKSVTLPLELCEWEEYPNLIVQKKCKSRRGEQLVTYENLPNIGSVRLNGVPNGSVVYGVVGADLYGGSGTQLAVVESFGFYAGGQGLENEDIIVAAGDAVAELCGVDNPACVLSASEVTDASLCTGSVDNPTAPAGKLCIYPVKISNAVAIEAKAVPDHSGNSGLVVEWTTSVSGATAFRGVWAYQGN